MRECSGARSDEINREHWGADGAVAVSRFRIRRALLLWAAAGAMLFGGGLTAHAQIDTGRQVHYQRHDGDLYGGPVGWCGS